MNSKKYVLSFLIVVGFFFWGNVCLWYGYTQDIFSMPDGHGDLTRMAFYQNVETMTPNYHPQKRHIEFGEYLKMSTKPRIDIVTVGDSFSQGGGGAYYQDYLADKYGLNVLNFNYMEDTNPLTVLRRLVETGILEEIKPKAVVLASVERNAVARFSASGSTGVLDKMTKDTFLSYYTVPADIPQTAQNEFFTGFMNNANIKLVKSRLKYYDSDTQISDEVYMVPLNADMFTAKGRENILFYLRDDLWYQNADIDYSQINHTLNETAGNMRDIGVKLIVMINADKLDLYSPYIVMLEDTPENNFIDMLSNQPKEYVLVDTKNILRQELEKGEKDVYWQDDTHWSWKAQHKVADEILSAIK